MLMEAVEKRSFLAHHVFLECEHLISEEDDCVSLLRELTEMGELFKNAGRLMRAMWSVVEQDHRRHAQGARWFGPIHHENRLASTSSKTPARYAPISLWLVTDSGSGGFGRLGPPVLGPMPLGFPAKVGCGESWAGARMR